MIANGSHTQEDTVNFTSLAIEVAQWRYWT